MPLVGIAQGGRNQGGKAGIFISDSPTADAFSRLRVSNPTTLFDNTQQYGYNSILWEQAVSGGNVTNSTNDSTVLLSNGAVTSGNYAYVQSRTYFRFLPGKSLACSISFCMDGGPVTNVRRRVGYFDVDNGVFLQLDGSTVSIVRRSSTVGGPGVPVDEVVPQASWNLDALNGAGPSGFVLDISKMQILMLDLQEAGRIRVYFDINGRLVPVHQFLNTNVLTRPHLATNNLPIRYEIFNTGTAGGVATLRYASCSVFSEGGFSDVRGIQFSVSRNHGASTAPPLAVTTRRPILSIRAKTTGPNGVRNNGQILPREYIVLGDTEACRVEVVLDGALTGASWAALGATYSLVEWDAAATAITGGVIVNTFFVGGGKAVSRSTEQNPFWYKPMAYTGVGNVQETVTLVATAVSATSFVNAAIIWQELY